MTRVRVVIDTNTLVPSIFFGTNIYYYIAEKNLIPLWNDKTKEEAMDIIGDLGIYYYRKGYIEYEDIEQAKVICNAIMSSEKCVSEMPNDWPQQSLDRKDDPFLWVALKGNAEYLITYDKKHLLKLGNFKGIPIGKPKDFFKWAKKNRPMK